MRFRKLTVVNFGPFYGRQEFTFGRDRGVWIVYGQNGRGKTSLLNAFRFALYGKILGRVAARDPEALINDVHRREKGVGQHEFQVILELTHDGHEYELTRTYQEGDGLSFVLRKDGSALSQQGAERQMRTIAPESISQFFLFDGELLRQYEELTEPGADSARQLRREVEQMLGITAVNRAVSDLREIQAQVDSELSRKMQADKNAAELGLALEEVTEKRAALVQERGKIEERLEQNRERREELEDKLSQTDAARETMGQLDALKRELTTTRVERQQALVELEEATPDAWMVALLPPAKARLDVLEAKLSEVDESRIHVLAHVYAAQRLRGSDECPTCAQTLDEPTRRAVLARVEERASSEDLDALEREAAKLKRQIVVLRRIEREAPGPTIEARVQRLSQLELNVSRLKEEIADLEEDLRDIDQAKVRAWQKERDELSTLISKDEGDLEAMEGRIAEQDVAMGRIRTQMRQNDIAVDPVLELKATVTEQLHELFVAAVEEYQSRTLTNVEDAATKLFRDMRTEQEYEGLSINEGYGLTIVDSDGEEIPGQSAGYAHLVALALIGALQRCSPVQGPIVMDSPFGRLDEEHTRSVVAALPQVADQVVLLAFEGEFDRDTAVDELGTSLVGEFDLARINSKHTELQHRKD